MEAFVKSFPDLTIYELYDILAARSAVFVVEQKCIYPDADGYDAEGLHVVLPFDGRLGAYCRILPPGLKYPEWAITRVLTVAEARGRGLARQLMEMALRAIAARDSKAAVRISAQAYLRKFYEDIGFSCVGGEYPEDGIPHIEMLKAA